MPFMQREDALRRLREQVAHGRPIIGAGAGTGISAKFAERGGVDIIIIYNSGRYRMAGRGSLAGLMPYGDANAIVVEMAREVLPVVKQTPVLAGVCGTDPFRLMPVFLRELKGMGRLYEQGRIDGAIGMGGSGGAAVIAAAMRALPLHVPKLLVFTLAAGDMKPYLGSRNITVMPAIVDVAGLNRVSRQIFAHAAGAIVGMASAPAPAAAERPILAASMFGNTTPCVDRARAALEAAGYEVLVFHATGAGGETMESLIGDGFVSGVLDVTTTEWADEVAGGILSAGPTRLDAAGRAGVPQVVAPGCLDMVNFGPRASVPAHYGDRLLYEWSPSVTLMRTTPEENVRLGEIFAEKLNAARGPVRVLIPLRGFSMLDSPGDRFWLPESDAAFVAALRAGLRPDIPVEELDANINDAAFADRAAQALLEMLRPGAPSAQGRGARG